MYKNSFVIALLLAKSSAFKLQQKTAGKPAGPTESSLVQVPYAGGWGVAASGAAAAKGFPTAVAKDADSLPHVAGADYNPGASSMDPNALVWQRAALHDGKVHGEKEHQDNANDLQEYGAKQEDVANARIPYASTLV
jgi:hypothetical protein